jgi:hypothetical protein
MIRLPTVLRAAALLCVLGPGAAFAAPASPAPFTWKAGLEPDTRTIHGTNNVLLGDSGESLVSAIGPILTWYHSGSFETDVGGWVDNYFHTELLGGYRFRLLEYLKSRGLQDRLAGRLDESGDPAFAICSWDGVGEVVLEIQTQSCQNRRSVCGEPTTEKLAVPAPPEWIPWLQAAWQADRGIYSCSSTDWTVRHRLQAPAVLERINALASDRDKRQALVNWHRLHPQNSKAAAWLSDRVFPFSFAAAGEERLGAWADRLAFAKEVSSDECIERLFLGGQRTWTNSSASLLIANGLACFPSLPDSARVTRLAAACRASAQPADCVKPTVRKVVSQAYVARLLRQLKETSDLPSLLTESVRHGRLSKYVLPEDEAWAWKSASEIESLWRALEPDDLRAIEKAVPEADWPTLFRAPLASYHSNLVPVATLSFALRHLARPLSELPDIAARKAQEELLSKIELPGLWRPATLLCNPLLVDRRVAEREELPAPKSLSLEDAQYLVSIGADPKIDCSVVCSPANGGTSCPGYLHAWGAPLDYLTHNAEVYRYLRSLGARLSGPSVQLYNTSYENTVADACRSGSLGILREVLQEMIVPRLGVTKPLVQKVSCLCLAGEAKALDVVRFLLAQQIEDDCGLLIWAVERRDLPYIQKLLDLGLSPDKPNNAGVTAREVARDPAILRILAPRGKKP